MSGLVEVLAAHWEIVTATRPARRRGVLEWFAVCVCGEPMPWDKRERAAAHQAHVADAIAAWLTSDAVVEVMWSVFDEHGHNGIDCRPRAGFDLTIEAALTAAVKGSDQ